MSFGVDGEIGSGWEVVDTVGNMFDGLVGTVGVDRILFHVLYCGLNNV